LYRERTNTLNELASAIVYFYQLPEADPVAIEKHITPEIRPVIRSLASLLETVDWTVESIHAALEHTIASNGLKFPKVAMPLRVMLTGGTQSPSIDAVMQLMGKAETLSRMKAFTD
jgi:glutamyl-tRNA synthetase